MSDKSKETHVERIDLVIQAVTYCSCMLACASVPHKREMLPTSSHEMMLPAITCGGASGKLELTRLPSLGARIP